MTDELAAPEGYRWGVTATDMDGVVLYVCLQPRVYGQGPALEWSWPLSPRDLAKQERIESCIRACKRALLRKYAENKRIEAAIHASR